MKREFDVKERVGKGSFGQVFRAIDKGSGRVVAIKIIDLEDARGLKLHTHPR
jgi:serine/threonine protein kinase